MNSQNLYKIRLAIIAVAFLVLSAFASNAQIKIGLPAGTAAASAVLDASNTGSGSLGFLAPQVPLTSLTVAGPVTSPATGLLVYNTATAGTSPNNVVPGFYYWNASQWVKMVVTATH